LAILGVMVTDIRLPVVGVAMPIPTMAVAGGAAIRVDIPRIRFGADGVAGAALEAVVGNGSLDSYPWYFWSGHRSDLLRKRPAFDSASSVTLGITHESMVNVG
jgi:hypothetical protein